MKNNEKTRKKKNQDGPIVIELNLSLTVGIIGAIIAIIVAITTVKVITTMIQANENKNAANESDINQYETYVTSTTKKCENCRYLPCTDRKVMICKELDIPRSNFNRYCRNEFQRLDANLICKLCNYFECEIGELIRYVKE